MNNKFVTSADLCILLNASSAKTGVNCGNVFLPLVTDKLQTSLTHL
jgi:hypothetical protein